MVELKHDAIVYYDGTYWSIVRIGRRQGMVYFYECREWRPGACWWCCKNIIVPAEKIRVPGKLELLVTLGVKANG